MIFLNCAEFDDKRITASDYYNRTLQYEQRSFISSSTVSLCPMVINVCSAEFEVL